MRLVLGVHDHQPVGNFDHVIAEVFQRSYLPFLEVVERHERFRFCLHITGPLLEWLQQHRPDYLERVASLARAGRVEMLGGGFYEPILAAIPESDRIGQLRLMNDWLQRHLGAEPRGVWLAERVWEPQLAGSLARAGVEFALLDDYHFVQAGLGEEELTAGPLLTDDLAAEVALLPISERLRYLIPFAEPEETIALCRQVHARDPEAVLVMVDDGEKFGAWPGTHELVYGRGWLERFIEALAAEADWLTLAHPSEVLAARPARRRVYMPPSSYFEMAEWALPMPAAERFAEAVHRYRADGTWDRMRPFFRGGFWRQFGQKYEESLLMQRRALLLHEEIDRAECAGLDSEIVDAARDQLWRAQCNCAYWHGVFGGLYLPHLRHAIYRHLIRGGRLLHDAVAAPRARLVSLVGPRGGDVRLCNRDLDLFLSPARGGAIVGLDDRRTEWNFQDTLRRRREAYHHRIEAAPLPADEADGDAGQGSEGVSIHDLQWTASRAVKAALVVDDAPRYSLLERFLHPGTDLARVADAAAACDGGDFAAAPMERLAPRFGPTGSLEDDRLQVTRTGHYRDPDGHEHPLTLVKTVELDAEEPRLTVTWSIVHEGKRDLHCLFASEWNLALFDGETLLGEREGGSLPVLDVVDLAPRSELTVLVPLLGTALEWRAGAPAAIRCEPIRTANQGEDGYHLTYQGHQFLFAWDLVLAAGTTAAFRLELCLGRREREVGQG